MYKVCSICKAEKTVESFYFKNKAKGTRSSYCSLCQNAFSQVNYSQNSARDKAKSKKRNKIVYDLNSELIWSYLASHPCVDCGESDPIVLEFDHMDDKSYNISCMKSLSTVRVLAEIEKCEIRCANCHRRKTAKQFGWHKNVHFQI